MRFQALDSWRGLAALFVAAFHANILGHFYDVPFLRSSWLFVDFFFVLSGFIITHAYGKRLVEGYDSFSFVIRRFGRLWPLHFAVLAAFLLAEISKWAVSSAGLFIPPTAAFDPSEKYSAVSFVSNLFLVHSLGVHDKLTWNEPSWSISTEFYAYILFAAFCQLKSRIVRTATAALLVTGCLIAVGRSGSFMYTTFDYGFFRCAGGFFVGHFCYRLYEWAHARGVKLSTPAEVIATGAVIIFVPLASHGALSMLAPFVFGVAVWVFALESGALSRLLLTKPFQRLGDWSYSIYMVHALIFMGIGRGVSVAEALSGKELRVHHEGYGGGMATHVISFGNEYVMDGLGLAYLVMVLVVAAASYRFLEVPWRTYFNGIANRRDESLRAAS